MNTLNEVDVSDFSFLYPIKMDFKEMQRRAVMMTKAHYLSASDRKKIHFLEHLGCFFYL